MNEADIAWIRDALSNLEDACADIANEIEQREDAADPEGRGGIGYGDVGVWFGQAHDLIIRAAKYSRNLKPAYFEDDDE